MTPAADPAPVSAAPVEPPPPGGSEGTEDPPPGPPGEKEEEDNLVRAQAQNILLVNCGGCHGTQLTEEAARADTLTLRATLRREESAPIVEAIRTWAHQQRALPESSLGKAIAYMLGLWPGLTRFLDDPRIALDNNATERGLRGLVVGRKNHYGSRSQRGTEVAALFYSLIESAKLCGVEPKAYLLQAAAAALRTRGTVTLPHTLLTP